MTSSNHSTNPKSPTILHSLSEAWLVIGLAFVFGIALAGVELGWKEKIAKNRELKIIKGIQTFFPQADLNSTQKIVRTIPTGTKGEFWHIKDPNQNTLGWAIPLQGQGFNGEIQLLLLLNPRGEKIVGIDVLKQSETPGLGDAITHPNSVLCRGYRAGLSTQKPVSVVKREAKVEENEVQALSGATISSESVTEIVNIGIATYLPIIQQEIQTREPKGVPTP